MSDMPTTSYSTGISKAIAREKF